MRNSFFKKSFSIVNLAVRYDRPLEPGIIIVQTPQPGERVDCGTVIGVTLSGEDAANKQRSLELCQHSAVYFVDNEYRSERVVILRIKNNLPFTALAYKSALV